MGGGREREGEGGREREEGRERIKQIHTIDVIVTSA